MEDADGAPAPRTPGTSVRLSGDRRGSMQVTAPGTGRVHGQSVGSVQSGRVAFDPTEGLSRLQDCLERASVACGLPRTRCWRARGRRRGQGGAAGASGAAPTPGRPAGRRHVTPTRGGRVACLWGVPRRRDDALAGAEIPRGRLDAAGRGAGSHGDPRMTGLIPLNVTIQNHNSFPTLIKNQMLWFPRQKSVAGDCQVQ